MIGWGCFYIRILCGPSDDRRKYFKMLFQMPLRVLPAMQDTDDLNTSGGHAVKQDVALQGEASAVRQKLGAFRAHEWLLDQQQELLLDCGQVAVGSGLSPLEQAVLVDVLEIISDGRRNDELS